MDSCYSTYTTTDEKIYLNKIGEHTEAWKRLNIHQQPNYKRKLLRGYLKSCERRVNWGSINKDAVISEARSILERL